MLHGALEICYEKKATYGRKLIEGVWYEDQRIGEKVEIDLVIKWAEVTNHDALVAMLRSALVVSPPEACLQHLTHLCLHKRLGSNDADRAVLLVDYVKALAGVPEFVMFTICRTYWENDPRDMHRRPFVPSIDELNDACRVLTESLERHLERVKNPKVASTPQARLAAPPEPAISRLEEARSMLALAQQNPDFLNVQGWQDEVNRLEVDHDRTASA